MLERESIYMVCGVAVAFIVLVWLMWDEIDRNYPGAL